MTSADPKEHSLAFALDIASTWDGARLNGRDVSRVEVATRGEKLVVTVTAPRGCGPPPGAPPGHTDQLWEHEVVEIFVLGVDGRYLELELGPWGHHLALLLDGPRNIVGKVEQVEYEVEAEDERWIGCASLDASHLPAPPHRVAAFAIRSDEDGVRHYHAAFPVPGDRPDFHQLHTFQPPRDAPEREYDRGSRARLSPYNALRFTGTTLFDRLARTVCAADCLPRKELYEAWEVARRTRRLFRGGRVVDVAAGHGLLGWTMLLLDESSQTAVCVDPKMPLSAARLAKRLGGRWPRLEGRVSYVESPMEEVELDGDDLVVSVHGCGALTDRVIDRVLEVRCRAALLPCCHDLKTCDSGGLESWMSAGMAVDTQRVHRLRAAGFVVTLKTIPSDISPQNRLILAAPE